MIMETTVNTDLVIFDLDGTLLDTIGDLAVACNAVLALRGLPQHSYEEYCHFVGNGIMRLVERALPEELRTPYTVAAVRADFVKYYTEHIDAYTKPYDGIPELVAGLVRRGVRIYEYTPGFIHQKQTLCDGETATVGTINFDYRSLYHHFENGVLLHGCGAIGAIGEDFAQIFEVSREVTEQYKGKRSMGLRIIQCILRLFAPLL